MTPAEARHQAFITNGSMKADELARTLIPAMLKKADKIKRGKVIRSGSQLAPTASAGLLELGFLLGGALQNSEVQRAFGICRTSAKDAMPPLLSPMLPQFFAPTEAILENNVRTSMSLLHDANNLSRTSYMLVRDEVVFARCWHLVYGLCGLVAICDSLCYLVLFSIFTTL